MVTAAGSRPARRRAGRVGAASVLVLLAATLAGCGSPSSGALVLYSGQHDQTVQAVVAAFERATGIRVVVRSDDEDTLAAEIVNEGASSPADVIWTENSPALEFLQGHGLLAHVDAATLAGTRRADDSPLGDWVGVSARVSVLVYDPHLLAATQVPRSVLELAAPRFAGKLALAPGETDFQPIVTAVARADGRAAALRWLAGLAANSTGDTVSDDEAVMSEVNSGLAAIGIVNQYYWYRLRAELGPSALDARLAFFAPHDPGYVLDVSGAAVLRHAHHPQAAQRFVAFLVSAAAQRILADPKRSMSYEYPLDAGVAVVGQPPLGALSPYPISVGELGDGQAAVALLRDAGLL